MAGLTRWVLAHRRVVVLAWLVLAIGGAGAASRISDELSQSFDAPGQPAFDANQEILEATGAGGSMTPIVAVAAGARDQARTAFDRIARAVPGARVVRRDGSSALPAPREGTSYALILPPPGPGGNPVNAVAVDAATQAAARERVGGQPVQITGIDALAEGSSGEGGTGLLIEVLLGAGGALVVLAFVFASFLAVVPLIIAAVSILTTFLVLFGLVQVVEVSGVVQFLVALIGLGVAIDYSLLVVVRWREERARGADRDEAIERAMTTSGSAVVFSGSTVGIGLLALVVVPVPFIRSIGFGGLLIPVITVLACVTLLPVMLRAFGERLAWPHRRSEQGASGPWTRWASWVVRRDRLAAGLGLLIMAVLALSALNLRPGDPEIDALASSGPAREGLVTLERAGVGPGALTPIEVLAPADRAAQAAERLGELDGVQATYLSEPTRGQRVIDVLLDADGASSAGADARDRVRSVAENAGLQVGGRDAQTADLNSAIYGSFPYMIALIAVITFLLLARAFRSVLLPVKAVVLNVISVAAAWGVITLVWQEGNGSELLFGLPQTGAITSWVPLATFAFLYGLSMDYEVFILARIREAYDETGSTERAVVEGLGRTGRLVTSAALILFLAFVALAASPGTELKIFATALAAGIILDATVVRALIVPALITLFGRWNWRLGPRLARLLRVRPSEPSEPIRPDPPRVERPATASLSESRRSDSR